MRAGTHLLIAFLVSALMRGTVASAAPPQLVPVVAQATGPRLLVVIAPLDPLAREQLGLLEHVVEGAAVRTGRFDVARGIDAFDPSAAAQRAQRDADATKLSADALKALDELDSAKATQLYTDALAAWRAGDLSRGLDGLLEAWAGKAAGHAVSGEMAQAKTELSAVLNVSAKAKLNEAQFTPELLRFAEAQRKAIAAAKGRLTVRTEPPGARVWVDGVFRGVGPATAEGLGPGKHVVVVGLEGYALALTDAAPGEVTVSLTGAAQAFTLSSALEKLAKDPEGPGRDAAARQLGDAAQADQVLLLVVKKSIAPDRLDATAVRLETRDGHNLAFRSGTLSVAAADLRGIDDWVGTLLERDDPRAGSKPVTHFAGGSGGVSGRRLAGFGLLAGAAACAASWGVFGFSALAEAKRFSALPQVESLKSYQAASSGRTFALIADISWGAGLALLALGLVLALLPEGGGGSSARGGSAAPKKATEDDTLRAYRESQEAQKRLDEQRAREAEEAKKKKEEAPPPTAPPPAEEKKETPVEQPAPVEEKKPLTAAEKKKLAAEEKKKAAEEKKRKAAEEKAEKKRKVEEAKAEKKRKAEEEKKAAEEKKASDDKRSAEEKKAADDKKAEEEKRAAEEKKAADDKKAEEEKRAAEEKKAADDRKAEEEKRAAEEKKAADEKDKPPPPEKPLTAAEKKKKAAEEKKRKAEEEKQRLIDEKLKEEEDARKAEEEKRRIAEEKKKAAEEEKQRREEEEKKRLDQPEPKEEDLRNF